MEPSEIVTILLARLERGLKMGMEALEGAKEEMEAAVAAEREACAKLLQDYAEDHPSREEYFELLEVVAAIRARGVAGKD